MKRYFKNPSFLFLVVSLLAVIGLAIIGPITTQLWFVLSIAVMALSIGAGLLGFVVTHRR